MQQLKRDIGEIIDLYFLRQLRALNGDAVQFLRIWTVKLSRLSSNNISRAIRRNFTPFQRISVTCSRNLPSKINIQKSRHKLAYTFGHIISWKCTITEFFDIQQKMAAIKMIRVLRSYVTIGFEKCRKRQWLHLT